MAAASSTPSTMLRLVLWLIVLFSGLPLHAAFRAGAYAQDISPAVFPAPVNGSMKGNFAKSVHDPMHARVLALHDGTRALVFCVVDACMLPREVALEAKRLVQAETGVRPQDILISATHTHSAATLSPVFQSDPDPAYVRTVPALIARGIRQALQNLEPAEVGWAIGSDPTQVFNRRWWVKAGVEVEDPFGGKKDRAWMNPGQANPKTSVPAGPVDPDVAVLAVRSAADQRPIGLLANYSLHYVGGNPAISADYFGEFAREMAVRLGAGDARYAGKAAFVGIMSNGTSGNINNVNFALPIRPARAPGEQIKIVARSVAEAAMAAYGAIQWRPAARLDTEEAELPLGVRKGTPAEVAEARQTLATTAKDKDGQWSGRKAIYARETLKLADYPDTVPVTLQLHRIGDLSVGAIPCEVFVEIGLRLKRTSPFTRHFTVSLANGYNGYLPTAEHHAAGGYETWRARSSYLEVGAAEQITMRLEAMAAALQARAGP
jgi:predicted secreted protein